MEPFRGNEIGPDPDVRTDAEIDRGTLGKWIANAGRYDRAA